MGVVGCVLVWFPRLLRVCAARAVFVWFACVVVWLFGCWFVRVCCVERRGVVCVHAFAVCAPFWSGPVCFAVFGCVCVVACLFGAFGVCVCVRLVVWLFVSVRVCVGASMFVRVLFGGVRACVWVCVWFCGVWCVCLLLCVLCG